MEVYKAPTVLIQFDAAKKILIQRWTGFSTSDIFREAIDKTVQFVSNNDVKAILNDTVEQAVVKPEDTQYASSKMPVLFQSGLKAMAIIVAKNVLTQMSLKKFKQDTQGANVRLFSSISDAQTWLNGAVT